jgi:hypothetical protein
MNFGPIKEFTLLIIYCMNTIIEILQLLANTMVIAIGYIIASIKIQLYYFL